MAYFTKEQKKELQPILKELAKDFGLKITTSIEHSSRFVVKVWGMGKDFNFHNEPYKDERNDLEDGEVNFLKRLYNVMTNGNHHKSNSQEDYFDVGRYTQITNGVKGY